MAKPIPNANQKLVIITERSTDLDGEFQGQEKTRVMIIAGGTAKNTFAGFNPGNYLIWSIFPRLVLSLNMRRAIEGNVSGVKVKFVEMTLDAMKAALPERFSRPVRKPVPVPTPVPTNQPRDVLAWKAWVRSNLNLSNPNRDEAVGVVLSRVLSSFGKLPQDKVHMIMVVCSGVYNERAIVWSPTGVTFESSQLSPTEPPPVTSVSLFAPPPPVIEDHSASNLLVSEVLEPADNRGQLSAVGGLNSQKPEWSANGPLEQVVIQESREESTNGHIVAWRPVVRKATRKSYSTHGQALSRETLAVRAALLPDGSFPEFAQSRGELVSYLMRKDSTLKRGTLGVSIDNTRRRLLQSSGSQLVKSVAANSNGAAGHSGTLSAGGPPCSMQALQSLSSAALTEQADLPDLNLEQFSPEQFVRWRQFLLDREKAEERQLHLANELLELQGEMLRLQSEAEALAPFVNTVVAFSSQSTPCEVHPLLNSAVRELFA